VASSTGADARPILFRGGLVRTADEAQPTARALVVRGDRIAYVGDEEGAREAARGPDDPAVVDLDGGVLVPGFVDPHAHPLMLGQTASWIDCSPERTSSIDEIVEALRSAAHVMGPDRPVRGYGYQHRNLAEKRHPTRHDLDRVSPDREVYVMNASGHGGVVNTLTLARRGITRDTPDPLGGRFGRDDDGELTGELYDAACDVLTSEDGVKLGPHGPNFHLDAPDGELVDQLIDAERQFLARGVTTIGDAQVSRREMRVFQLAARRGGLRARYAVFVLSHLLDEVLALGLRSGFGDDRLRLAGVKFYADGTLGGSTAYFPEGYATDPCRHGQLYHSRDELAQLLGRAHRAGLATATHAQSPAAIEIVLDAVAAAQAASPDGPRHRIEHAGLPLPDQVQRMAGMGVTTVSQPQHYYGWGEGIVESVGPLGERYNPLGEYERSGVAWALSSDAPVAPPDPLLAMEIAVTRRTRRGSVFGFPDLAVSAESAFRACTIAAARALDLDDRIGSLAVGKHADLVVLDADPLAVPTDAIHSVAVRQTWIGGARVDGASEPRD
jgi:predicted amidohydrolase YtcJ